MTFALKVFTDGPYDRGEISATVAYTKYFTALLACFFAFAHSLKYGEKIFVREFNKLLIVVAVFTLVSFILQAVTQKLAIQVYIELIKLAMPIFLAYLVMNSLDRKIIYRCMEIILIITIIGYLFDLRSAGVSPLDILESDFQTSDSATEHAGVSDIALMLSFYFLYFIIDKWPAPLAVALCILAFKRLAIVMVILACVLSLFPRIRDGKVRKSIIWLCAGFTLGAIMLWFWLLLPAQESLFISIFGEGPSEFTSGRSEIMRWLINSGFQSCGFGSANDLVMSVFSVPFEMDFIKIALELTPAAVVLFVCVFWSLARSSFWAFLIIGYYVINMITSDSLTANFAFTLAYIVIGLVTADTDCRSGALPHLPSDSVTGANNREHYFAR